MFSSRVSFDKLLPAGTVTAYRLSGDNAPIGDLRGYNVFAIQTLSDEQERLLRTILTTTDSFGGDGARCFAPGVGFTLGSGAERLEVLVCLQCHWVLFFHGDTQMTEALSETGHHQLATFYAELYPKRDPNRA